MQKRNLKIVGLLTGTAVAGIVVAGTGASAPAPDGASSVTCTDVPNEYDLPFSVCDDELFIFAANYKPLEATVTEKDRRAERFFNEVIGNRLRAAFPHLKITYATWDYPIRYDDLEAVGVVPDIIIENPRTAIDKELEPRGWVMDLMPLVVQRGLDLGQLNRATIELVRSRSDGGLYAIPLFVDDYLLFYNKRIFDRFNVRHPTAGMTYDQIFRLARKLTRQVGLDAYKGYMQHPDTYLELNQLGLYPFLPTGSEEPLPEQVAVDITAPGWRALGENMYRFLTIEHNTFTTVDDFLKGDMSRPGHVAMAVDTMHKMPMYALNELYMEDGDEEYFEGLAESIDMGVTSVPVLHRRSEATYQPNTLAVFITPQSTMLKEALDVVTWLVSEEAQVALSRKAIKGVLETDAVVSSFAADIPELADIDTSGVYWGENAALQGYERTEYWNIPLFMVFRQHVLIDGMTVGSGLVVTEAEDIPAYIQSRAEAGFDY